MCSNYAGYFISIVKRYTRKRVYYPATCTAKSMHYGVNERLLSIAGLYNKRDAFLFAISLSGVSASRCRACLRPAQYRL